MTDREREALIDRLKLASAWAFSMNGVPDDPRDDTPMAAIEDAIAVIAASPWLPLPDEVVEGVAPWDGRPVLLCRPMLAHPYEDELLCPDAVWCDQWFRGDDEESPRWLYAVEEPTYWMPGLRSPLPYVAPPAGEVG